MLTAEENERLTRVGPGTPMGTLFRNYWQPVAPKQQLVERRVMPVRLYGQDMVLFLDGQGRVGLVDDRCAHRQVKLECAKTNDAGIRCPYHGWTFDTTGQCVDQPAEPAGSTFKDGRGTRRPDLCVSRAAARAVAAALGPAGLG
jgi:phenylpropionate dioxygenase-like ring-hydroxylating dioxygenase large terminal subunit